MSSRPRTPIAVTQALLRRMRVPQPGDAADKDDRGQVLVVGGSKQVAGAVLLAGVAALRAGAGKLQLATVGAAAPALGIAVPEALIVALPASRTGEIAGTRAHGLLANFAATTNALLIGPGMSSDRAAQALMTPLVRRVNDACVVVLDAAAVVALAGNATMLRPLNGRAVLTPHAGEMASLLGADKHDVERDPGEVARTAAARFSAVVALKGAETYVADADGALYRYSGGSVGLATSGSGDTLAGIAAGLAARGAPPVHAALWAAYLHGAAGRVLARRLGRVGFLARELLDELPPLLRRLS